MTVFKMCGVGNTLTQNYVLFLYGQNFSKFPIGLLNVKVANPGSTNTRIY